jgi:hypothetical protein
MKTSLTLNARHISPSRYHNKATKPFPRSIEIMRRPLRRVKKKRNTSINPASSLSGHHHVTSPAQGSLASGRCEMNLTPRVILTAAGTILTGAVGLL